jgi:hypothetical protein
MSFAFPVIATLQTGPSSSSYPAGDKSSPDLILRAMAEGETDRREFWLSYCLLSKEAFSFGPRFLVKGQKKTCSAQEHCYP